MSVEKPEYYSSENQLPRIIRKVAELNGVEMSDDTLRGMEVVASACGIADDEVDRCRDADKREAIVNNALLFLSGKEDLSDTGSQTYKAYEESMRNLKNLTDTFPEERKHILMLRLRIWNRLSEDQKNITDQKLAVFKRRVDLNVTAGVYLTAIKDDEREAVGYRQFHRDFKKMVRIAGMLDDAMDMQDDFENGITQIRPTVKNRLRLISVAVREGVGMFSYAFNPRLLGESVDIMKREYRRRFTPANYEQYRIGPESVK